MGRILLVRLVQSAADLGLERFSAAEIMARKRRHHVTSFCPGAIDRVVLFPTNPSEAERLGLGHPVRLQRGCASNIDHTQARHPHCLLSPRLDVSGHPHFNVAHGAFVPVLLIRPICVRRGEHCPKIYAQILPYVAKALRNSCHPIG
jgi:hypothetical protein